MGMSHFAYYIRPEDEGDGETSPLIEESSSHAFHVEAG